LAAAQLSGPAAIDEQLIDPPRLVRTLLWPTLGSPAVLDPGKTLDIVLDRPYANPQLTLIPRAALAELDHELYALPPMPNGDAQFRARIAVAQTAGEGGSLDIILLPEERKALVDVLTDAKYQAARKTLLARVKNDSHQDARSAIERFRSGVARIVERGTDDKQKLIPATDCVRLGVRQQLYHERPGASNDAAGCLYPGAYGRRWKAPRFSD
jgi:hypothetical protein